MSLADWNRVRRTRTTRTTGIPLTATDDRLTDGLSR